MHPFQLYPLGDAAIVLEFGDEIGPTLFARVSAVAAYLDQHPFAGMIEYVPAYTTVTIYYNPWIISEKGRYDPYARAIAIVQEMIPMAVQARKPPARRVEIPVCYGGACGPDLEAVAKHCQLSPRKVISLHSKAEYTVYMIGFAPGFPYLGGLNPKIAVPRKSTPLQAVPPGSVGIAGNQTGIYPIETPGGWQLIGRTYLKLFDPHRSEPSLLRAGDIVRFVPVSEEVYETGKELQDEH